MKSMKLEKRTEGEREAYIQGYNAGRKINRYKHKLEEDFKKEIAYANEDIDLSEGANELEENYNRGYLGGILCAYRIVFGKNYEGSEEEE